MVTKKIHLNQVYTRNNLGIPYASWHPKNPKNAIAVPQSVARTK